MTEDNSRDTDHHHTPEAPHHYLCEDLHACTVFTRRWYRIDLQDLLPLDWIPARQTPGVRAGQTVPQLFVFKVGRFGHCATSFVENTVSRGLKWLSAASLGTGGVVMW